MVNIEWALTGLKRARLWAKLGRVGPARPSHVWLAQASHVELQTTTRLESRGWSTVDSGAWVYGPQTRSEVDHIHLSLSSL
jgi:hypothetical protein